jgi:FixJ family two-component response regulator
MEECEPMVFIVDDDDSVRKAIKRLINSVGMKVETFVSAQEFLSRERYDGPCCLVLDVRMPGLSGLDLQQELTKADRILPIIFITGHGSIPMTVRAMKAGAVDFLEKPFDDQALLDLIKHAIDQDKQNKQEHNERRQTKKQFESLTSREREVFAHIVKGDLNKQVAFKLGISEKTVKVHRGRIMEKLEVNSLADLVRIAERLDPSKAIST